MFFHLLSFHIFWLNVFKVIYCRFLVCEKELIHFLFLSNQTGQGLYSACPPSVGWTAPEVLENPNALESDGSITIFCDVYSYAIVMWELVTGDDPFEEFNTVKEVVNLCLLFTLCFPYLFPAYRIWHELSSRNLLLSEPLVSLITNFLDNKSLWNDNECQILFITWWNTKGKSVFCCQKIVPTCNT